MKLYLAVTADQYELPVVVADSLKELGQKFGLSSQAAYDKIRQKSVFKKEGVRFITVEVSDDDEALG